MHFVQDKKTRFELAIECGNLDVAVETARQLDRPESWTRLGEAALAQGNHRIVEIAYQKTKNFEKLSFLYLAVGATDKLGKMAKIAETRKEPMSRFHNALYLGDVVGRINVLRSVDMCELAHPPTRTGHIDSGLQCLSLI